MRPRPPQLHYHAQITHCIATTQADLEAELAAMEDDPTLFLGETGYANSLSDHKGPAMSQLYAM